MILGVARNVWLTSAVGLLLCATSSLHGQQTTALPSENGDLLTYSSAIIGSGDLLDITVLGVPDLTQHVRVEANGSATLLLIGDVHVDGATGPEAALLIAKRYEAADLLIKPNVTIFVEQSLNRRVKVLGEVTSPGIYPLLGRQTALDAVAAAGGPNAKASHHATLLHTDGKEESIDLQAPEANQIALHTGDTLTIKRAPIVYAIGEVIRPGGFILDDQTKAGTVLGTLALSGGPTRLAKLSDTLILRRTDHGVIIKRRVPMNHLVNGELEDLAIEDGDILYVPLSQVKQTFQQAVVAAFQITTGLIVYGH